MQKSASSRKLVGWTVDEQQVWRERLTETAQLDNAVCAAWDWMLPLEPEAQNLFKSYAHQVMDRASKDTKLQKAIEQLNGPASHLPAFFWRIVQTLEMERNSSQRDSELWQRKLLLRRAKTVIKGLSKVNDNYHNLVIATRERRDLCIAWTPTVLAAQEGFDNLIWRLLETNETLNTCLHSIEEAERYFWKPLAKQAITAHKLEAYSVQQLFYIAKEMHGNRRWISMFTVMDAVASVLGYENPFDLPNLKEGWKALRANPLGYEQRFKEAIERRRMEYQMELRNVITRLHLDGILTDD